MVRKGSGFSWLEILAACLLLLPMAACQLPSGGAGKALCVDLHDAGCYDTIGGAIANAPEGATIPISADVYEEIIYIKKSVTLQGTIAGPDSGQRTVIHSDNPNAPVLHIQVGKAVRLYNMEVTGGHFGSSGGGGIINDGSLYTNDVIVDHNSTTGYGGGILNLGDLHMENSLVQYNSAIGLKATPLDVGYGGGIYNHQGMVVLIGTDVSYNTANGRGGGIYTNASLTVTDGNISHNEAAWGGGGLAVEPWEHNATNTPDVQLERVTIDNNHSAASGGGIYSMSSALTLTNVTLSGNATDEDGGGMSTGRLYNPVGVGPGSVTITSSTIANNRALYHGGGIAAMYAGPQTITAGSTIFAGNEGGNCNFYTMNETFLSWDYNISDDDTCNLPFHADKMNTDPMLFPLGLNAPGRVKTHALKTGSPADDLNDVGCVAVDARGVARGNPCDAGAYEGTLDPFPSHAATAVISKNATCRSGPGTAYSAMGYLNAGESHSISGRNAERTWFKLESCWVAASLLETQGDVGPVPVLEVPPPPTPEPTLAIHPRAACSSWTSPEACKAAGCTWQFSSAGPGSCK